MGINLEQLILNLQSNEEAVVTDSIRSLRRYGNASSIEPLIDCFFSSDSAIVRQEIVDLLGDIKDNSVAGIWAQQIEKYRGSNGFREMLACCWISDVDFSNELMVFARILIQGKYYECLEAVTIIQENLPLASDEMRGELCSFVQDRYVDMSGPVQGLVKTFLKGLCEN